MKLRKVVSLTALISFVLVVLTSVILYIVPQGRVAYWADWRLWGLSKEQWGDLHINLGLLFLLALFLHIYLNWRQITAYLKDKSRTMKVFTPDFNLALALAVVFTVGTLALWPPFSYVLTLNEWFQDEGAKTYGEPPYGHAELSSLKTFARQLDLDLDKAEALLREQGLAYEGPGQAIVDIAKANGLTPKGVYDVIQSAARPVDISAGLPETPPSGTGNRTVADLVAEYGLNYPSIERGLRERGVEFEARMTIKEVAERHGKGPLDIYTMIREIARP
jgi:succinate dehydrogenase hydrophobic anchor subunit